MTEQQCLHNFYCNYNLCDVITFFCSQIPITPLLLKVYHEVSGARVRGVCVWIIVLCALFDVEFAIRSMILS